MPLKWNQHERQRRSAPSPTRPGLARVATSSCASRASPTCVGGGLGRGVVVMAQSCIRQLLPPPPTPPHKGEGSTPCAARNCPASNSTGTALVRNPFRLNRDFAP